MSHMSKISLRVTNKDTLTKVLQEMGYNVQTGEGLTLNTPWIYGADTHEKVDILFNKQEWSKKDFAGFRETKEGFELMGDDYGTGQSIDRIGREVRVNYAKTEVKDQFNLNPDLADFQLTDEKVNEKGEIVLEYERWN